MVRLPKAGGLALSVLLALSSAEARADVITDWNRTAAKIVAQAKPGTPVANRIMALVQTSVYESVNAITWRYPADPLTPPHIARASVEAAVAAANRAALMELLPKQAEAIEAAYRDALASVAEGEGKRDGIALGTRAAAAVLAFRQDDGALASEHYRPVTSPGVYVPTVLPAVPQWPQRRPWLMATASQFRPVPPPTLDSVTWARDYNEIKALGGRDSQQRTPAQLEQARFWEASFPAIYYGVVYSVAERPGRDASRNARLLMAVTQAMDDAAIAVFDAKYHYQFWRPVTAIRNGDRDGNDATEPDAGWVPLIDTPMHPEYPCAHCTIGSAVGTVLAAELGKEPMPRLATTSESAPGIEHSWTSVEAFVDEVSQARIFDGVHFRTSTEVGKDMGSKVGRLAAQRYLGAAP